MTPDGSPTAASKIVNLKKPKKKICDAKTLDVKNLVTLLNPIGNKILAKNPSVQC